MTNDLTPARLRELIAAATPGPWDRPTDEGDHLAICLDHPETGHQCIADFPYRNINFEQDSELVRYLVNNAPALADALEAKKLLDALMGYVLSVRRGNTNEWMEGLVETLNATEMAIGGKDRCEYRRSDGVIRVRRAAKDAHDGNI